MRGVNFAYVQTQMHTVNLYKSMYKFLLKNLMHFRSLILTN